MSDQCNAYLLPLRDLKPCVPDGERFDVAVCCMDAAKKSCSGKMPQGRDVVGPGSETNINTCANDDDAFDGNYNECPRDWHEGHHTATVRRQSWKKPHCRRQRARQILFRGSWANVS
jgi:hypothetical protein